VPGSVNLPELMQIGYNSFVLCVYMCICIYMNILQEMIVPTPALALNKLYMYSIICLNILRPTDNSHEDHQIEL